MTKTKQLTFNDDTIRALFGHETAEDDNFDRLKQFYFKSRIYDSMKSSLPLYILVGHKGVGKSALLKVLQSEDQETGKIPIQVQPNDLSEIFDSSNNFLKKISLWSNGLSSIIFNKLIESIQFQQNTSHSWVAKLNDIISSMLGKKIETLQNEYIKMNSVQFTTLLKNSLFEEKQIIVYMDDLDRGWKCTENDISNISALINAIRDLCRQVRNIKFRIALRSDVYYAYRTSDESTDKIESCVLWQKWSNHEIFLMLLKRIQTYFGREFDENSYLNTKQSELADLLDDVFEPRFSGKGHWTNAPVYRVLMSLIRKRPRDLVKLCTLAAKEAYANNHHKIQTSDLEAVFQQYSQDRLQDTINEYKSELPRIEDLLLKMKPTTKEMESGSPCLFSKDSLIIKLRNICSMSNFIFIDGKTADPQRLITFLYKINFLTARKDISNGIERIYYDEDRYISNDYTDFGYKFEVHPAFRWALQPTTLQELFDQIELPIA